MLGAIAAGGVLGASTRVGLSNLVPSLHDGFPWDTLIENASGSLMLGVVLVVVAHRLPPTTLVRPFLAVGFLGSFTTFSAFIVESDSLVRDGDAAHAIAYIVATIVTGLAAAVVGIVATTWLMRRGDPAEQVPVR